MISEDYRNLNAIPPPPVDIKSQDYGYIKGIDLLNYLKNDFLVNVWVNTNNPLSAEYPNVSALSNAVYFAMNRVKDALFTIYDLDHEFSLRDNNRNWTVVNMVCLFACYEIAGIDEKVKATLKERYFQFEERLNKLRMRKESLPNLFYAKSADLSMPVFVSNNSNYLF